MTTRVVTFVLAVLALIVQAPQALAWDCAMSGPSSGPCACSRAHAHDDAETRGPSVRRLDCCQRRPVVVRSAAVIPEPVAPPTGLVPPLEGPETPAAPAPDPTRTEHRQRAPPAARAPIFLIHRALLL